MFLKVVRQVRESGSLGSPSVGSKNGVLGAETPEAEAFL